MFSRLCHGGRFSRTIHSRTQGGQRVMRTPCVSHCTRNRTASTSARPTSNKSSTTSRECSASTSVRRFYRCSASFLSFSIATNALTSASDYRERRVGRLSSLIMRSVRRRLSEPSTTFLMWSGRLLRPPASMSKPNLLAMRTLSRKGASASPASSSLVCGPYTSAVSKNVHAFFVRLTDDADALAAVCRRTIVGADAHATGTYF